METSEICQLLHRRACFSALTRRGRQGWQLWPKAMLGGYSWTPLCGGSGCESVLCLLCKGKAHHRCCTHSLHISSAKTIYVQVSSFVLQTVFINFPKCLSVKQLSMFVLILLRNVKAAVSFGMKQDVLSHLLQGFYCCYCWLFACNYLWQMNEWAANNAETYMQQTLGKPRQTLYYPRLPYSAPGVAEALPHTHKIIGN